MVYSHFTGRAGMTALTSAGVTSATDLDRDAQALQAAVADLARVTSCG
jgi:hypothetical protein